MNTPILSDIKVLGNLLALNLNGKLYFRLCHTAQVCQRVQGSHQTDALPGQYSLARNFLLKIWPLWVPSVSPIRTASRSSSL